MNRADRKKQLIAQGALYRAEVMLAKQAAHDAAQPQALLGSALPKIAFAALALIRSRNGAGLPAAALQTVLPLATGAAAALAKRKPLLKAIVGGALAAGVAVLVLKRKRAAREAGHASSESVA